MLATNLKQLALSAFLCSAFISAVAMADKSVDATSSSSGPQIGLEEIVVTAEKRQERLQDVPVSVTAISADRLLDTGQLRLQDYYASVPGLTLISGGNGDAFISIRGVSTGAAANPTVGITVDDLPFGSTTALGSRTGAPDIDPGDLARVEVLRGPQGTLYGANSIGGLLKFVTIDPSTDGISGRAQVDVNRIHNGDDAGYGVRGAINVPLSDTIAIRASGFTRRDPGYVNDSALGETGLNQADVYGGRLSALWRPSADWSLKLGAIFQNTHADGTSGTPLGPGLGDLQQVFALPDLGYDHDVNIYSALLTGNLGGINLTSVSGYSMDKFRAKADFSYLGACCVPPLPGGGVAGVESYERNETDKFSQEIRLSSSIGSRFDWLLGAFYTRENTPTHDVYSAVDPSTLQGRGVVLDDPYPTTYAEDAVFADLTFHLTDRFDVQIGGRESENRQTYEEPLSGPLVPLFFGKPSPFINPLVHTKENSFTYLITPRFKVSSDFMVYARLASGYRPGGPNPTCALYGYPCSFSPDKTYNYEIGVKGEVLDHRVSIDASVYSINWKDIQLQVAQVNSGALYYTNGSQAKSQGVELSVQTKPLDGLSLDAWITWNDAKLTADLPPGPPGTVVGLSGDPLPYSSRFSGNVSVEDDFSLTNNLTGFVGASSSFVGNRQGLFTTSFQQPRQDLPSYIQTNVRGGLRFHSTTLNLFVNNIADSRGALSYSLIGPNTFNADLIQPRTVGMSIVKTF